MKRVDIKAILGDPAKRRELMVRTIIATQAREGITTSRAQAEAAYDKVQGEKKCRESMTAQTTRLTSAKAASRKKK
jgi:hypothetical protein